MAVTRSFVFTLTDNGVPIVGEPFTIASSQPGKLTLSVVSGVTDAFGQFRTIGTHVHGTAANPVVVRATCGGEVVESIGTLIAGIGTGSGTPTPVLTGVVITGGPVNGASIAAGTSNTTVGQAVDQFGDAFPGATVTIERTAGVGATLDPVTGVWTLNLAGGSVSWRAKAQVGSGTPVYSTVRTATVAADTSSIVTVGGIAAELAVADLVYLPTKRVGSAIKAPSGSGISSPGIAGWNLSVAAGSARDSVQRKTVQASATPQDYDITHAIAGDTAPGFEGQPVVFVTGTREFPFVGGTLDETNPNRTGWWTVVPYKAHTPGDIGTQFTIHIRKSYGAGAGEPVVPDRVVTLSADWQYAVFTYAFRQADFINPVQGGNHRITFEQVGGSSRSLRTVPTQPYSGNPPVGVAEPSTFNASVYTWRELVSHGKRGIVTKPLTYNAWRGGDQAGGADNPLVSAGSTIATTTFPSPVDKAVDGSRRFYRSVTLAAGGYMTMDTDATGLMDVRALAANIDFYTSGGVLDLSQSADARQRVPVAVAVGVAVAARAGTTLAQIQAALQVSLIGATGPTLGPVAVDWDWDGWDYIDPNVGRVRRLTGIIPLPDGTTEYHYTPRITNTSGAAINLYQYRCAALVSGYNEDRMAIAASDATYDPRPGREWRPGWAAFNDEAVVAIPQTLLPRDNATLLVRCTFPMDVAKIGLAGGLPNGPAKWDVLQGGLQGGAHNTYQGGWEPQPGGGTIFKIIADAIDYPVVIPDGTQDKIEMGFTLPDGLGAIPAGQEFDWGFIVSARQMSKFLWRARRGDPLQAVGHGESITFADGRTAVVSISYVPGNTAGQFEPGTFMRLLADRDATGEAGAMLKALIAHPAALTVSQVIAMSAALDADADVGPLLRPIDVPPAALLGSLGVQGNTYVVPTQVGAASITDSHDGASIAANTNITLSPLALDSGGVPLAVQPPFGFSLISGGGLIDVLNATTGVAHTNAAGTGGDAVIREATPVGGGFVTHDVTLHIAAASGGGTQILSAIADSHDGASIAAGASVQLTPVAMDQFGFPMAVQPAASDFLYSLSSGGAMVDSYTAGLVHGNPTSPGGDAVVQEALSDGAGGYILHNVTIHVAAAAGGGGGGGGGGSGTLVPYLTNFDGAAGAESGMTSVLGTFARDGAGHYGLTVHDPSSDNIALHDCGSADATATITLAPAAMGEADVRLIFRAVDSNSHWLLRINSGAGQVDVFRKIASGDYTQVGPTISGLTIASGDTFAVTTSGTDFTFTHNGVALTGLAATGQTFNQTVTKFGVGHFTAGVAPFDSFSIG